MAERQLILAIRFAFHKKHPPRAPWGSQGAPHGPRGVLGRTISAQVNFWSSGAHPMGARDVGDLERTSWAQESPGEPRENNLSICLDFFPKIPRVPGEPWGAPRGPGALGIHFKQF